MSQETPLVVARFLDGPCEGDRGEVPPPEEGYDIWRHKDDEYHQYIWTDNGLRFTGCSLTTIEMVWAIGSRERGRGDIALHSDARDYGEG